MEVITPETIRLLARQFNLLLGIQLGAVGVRLLHDADAFHASPCRTVRSGLAYCVMVKLAASKGFALKAAGGQFRCPGGERALGITPPNEFFRSGRLFAKFGLYNSVGTARHVQEAIRRISHPVHGIEVFPLDQAHARPDVAIIVGSPYASMRLVQGYTWSRGMKTNFRMAGNQALCSECTATPYETNDLNVSLLCSGTRCLAQWKAEDMAAGFPFALLRGLIDGLYATLDAVETDTRKRLIQASLAELGVDIPVQLGKNYFRPAGKP